MMKQGRWIKQTSPLVQQENMIQYIESGEIKPLVAQEYPLQKIKEAQKDFLAKKFVGKLVLLPPKEGIYENR